jgi:hypothetical protein
MRVFVELFEICSIPGWDSRRISRPSHGGLCDITPLSCFAVILHINLLFSRLLYQERDGRGGAPGAAVAVDALASVPFMLPEVLSLERIMQKDEKREVWLRLF